MRRHGGVPDVGGVGDVTVLWRCVGDHGGAMRRFNRTGNTAPRAHYTGEDDQGQRIHFEIYSRM